MRKVEFIYKNGKEISLERIESQNSFLKAVSNKEDVSAFALREDKEIPLKDLFHLLINVKNVGAFHCYLPLEIFNKSNAVKAIEVLKYMEIVDQDSANNKVVALFAVIKSFKPELIVYEAKGQYLLTEDELDCFAFDYRFVYVKGAIITLPVLDEEEVEAKAFFRKHKESEETSSIEIEQKVQEEPKVIEQPVEKPVEKKIEEKPFYNRQPDFYKKEEEIEEIPQDIENMFDKSKKEEDNKQVQPTSKKIDIIGFFKNIWSIVWPKVCEIAKIIADNKFHFIYAIVSSLLMGFSCSIAFHNIYLGKGIAAFFLVCSLIGAVLSFFIYFDLFKQHEFKELKLSITSIVFNVIGIGLSLGGYAIYANIQNSKVDAIIIDVGPVILYTILISVLLTALSIVLAYFIRKKFKSNEQ